MIGSDRLLKELIFALNYSGLDSVFVMDTLGDYLGGEIEKRRISKTESKEITLSMLEFQKDLHTCPSAGAEQKKQDV